MTQKDRWACDWKCRLKRVGGEGRQIRSPIQRRGVISMPSGNKAIDSMLPRKTSMGIRFGDRTANRHR